jgi:ATP-dependent DNA helicase RecG
MARAAANKRTPSAPDAQSRDTEPGPAQRSPFDKLGLRSDWDFVLHLPLRYEDETRITPIDALQPGTEAQVEGVIEHCEVAYRGRRQLLARVRDDSGELLLRFLHFYPSTQKQLAVGKRVRLFGSVRGGLMGVEMVHPRVRVADEASALPQRLTPVYPATEGVSQALLRKRIAQSLLRVTITDSLPLTLRTRYRLPELAPALQGLHHPPPDADQAALSEHRHPLWARVKFDELLAQQLSLRIARAKRSQQRAPVLAAAGSLTQRLLAALPFQLTAAQQRVWRELEADLARGQPTHRLVQGDVGSGKTVIAALAAARAIEAGHQAALMAPTEILAEQHFRKIEQWLAPLGIQIAWLAGKLKPAEKRAAQAAVADGSAQLVVGTHALIQDKVEFARLGLAIVDEQHRFGVAQRLRLRGGGGEAVQPHLVMLSATPIPRTLAMSFMADLDVSTIDELPPGR